MRFFDTKAPGVEIIAYMRLEQLSADEKERKGIKVNPIVPRFDIVSSEIGSEWRGRFDAMKSTRGKLKGNVSMTLSEQAVYNSKGSAKRNIERNGMFLQSRGLNFSGMRMLSFPMGRERLMYGYGTPDPSENYRCGKRNPWFGNDEISYVFIVTSDWQKLEIVVVRYGRNNAQNIALAFRDGMCDKELEQWRRGAAISRE